MNDLKKNVQVSYVLLANQRVNVIFILFINPTCFAEPSVIDFLALGSLLTILGCENKNEARSCQTGAK